MKLMCSNIPGEKVPEQTACRTRFQSRSRQNAVKNFLKLHRENSKNYRNRLIGTTVEVLMEEAQEIDGICWQVGHTREYVKVAVPVQEKYQVNDILTVRSRDFYSRISFWEKMQNKT